MEKENKQNGPNDKYNLQKLEKSISVWKDEFHQ